MHYIVGLGNPGEKYKISRHNTGRIVLAEFLKAQKMDEPESNKKLNALTTEGKIKKENFLIIMPETYMNNSGKSLKNIITSPKKGRQLIVIHDDLDLSLGKFKISFGSGSAGHRGVESIMRAVKTKEFARIRVGISPSTPKGKVKKPEGKKIVDHILGNFKPTELQILKKVSKKIASVIETIILESVDRAMNEYN